MTDETANTLDFIVRLITLVAIITGLILTMRQLRATARQKTSEYITNLQESFYTNADLMNIYYLIEYGDFKYEDFHKSSYEKPLDALLYQFDSIAKIYLLSNFNISDLGHFAYRYLVVYQDKEVKKYLNFLDEWYANRGLKLKPFDAFRKVGGVIEKKYYDKELDIDRIEKPIEKHKISATQD